MGLVSFVRVVSLAQAYAGHPRCQAVVRTPWRRMKAFRLQMRTKQTKADQVEDKSIVGFVCSMSFSSLWIAKSLEFDLSIGDSGCLCSHPSRLKCSLSGTLLASHWSQVLPFIAANAIPDSVFIQEEAWDREAWSFKIAHSGPLLRFATRYRVTALSNTSGLASMFPGLADERKRPYERTSINPILRLYHSAGPCNPYRYHMAAKSSSPSSAALLLQLLGSSKVYTARQKYIDQSVKIIQTRYPPNIWLSTENANREEASQTESIVKIYHTMSALSANEVQKVSSL